MSNPLYSQEAEDDGYGAWLRDCEQDRRMVEAWAQEEAIKNHNEVKGEE